MEIRTLDMANEEEQSSSSSWNTFARLHQVQTNNMFKYDIMFHEVFF